jgi:glycosyltransferase involved in cell wall biosynthesis
MIVYLTFNEAPTGIFYSQVADVVNFVNKELKSDVSLWCFISVRNFHKSRKKIKALVKNAKVIPMIPGLHRWKANRFILNLLLRLNRVDKVIARSVWATWLALKAKEKNLVGKVVYDGRGAIYHESLEYSVVRNKKMVDELLDIECACVIKSDFRIAVSNQLKKHWQEVFNYKDLNTVVIPCTVSENVFQPHGPLKNPFIEVPDAVIGIYSGSAAGWQSSLLFFNYLKNIFANQDSFRLIILSPDKESWEKLTHEFGRKIFLTSAEPSRVNGWLQMADYGFLLREDSVTNRVASPVKFAEYLAAGLRVVISPNLGDFSDFVIEKDCGIVIAKDENYSLARVTDKEKIKNRKLALDYFLKLSHINGYKKILEQ